jgi:hypothetical protein
MTSRAASSLPTFQSSTPRGAVLDIRDDARAVRFLPVLDHLEPESTTPTAS